MRLTTRRRTKPRNVRIALFRAVFSELPKKRRSFCDTVYSRNQRRRTERGGWVTLVWNCWIDTGRVAHNLISNQSKHQSAATAATSPTYSTERQNSDQWKSHIFRSNSYVRPLTLQSNIIWNWKFFYFFCYKLNANGLNSPIIYLILTQ